MPLPQEADGGSTDLQPRLQVIRKGHGRLERPIVLQEAQGSAEGTNRPLDVFIRMRRREPPVEERQIDALKDEGTPELVICLQVRMTHQKAVVEL